jgi:hypothetical protein
VNERGAARMLASLFGEDWGEYPAPHTDEDDTCQCPDHRRMRAARTETGEG